VSFQRRDIKRLGKVITRVQYSKSNTWTLIKT
jgi:hypothetical protein